MLTSAKPKLLMVCSNFRSDLKPKLLTEEGSRVLNRSSIEVRLEIFVKLDVCVVIAIAFTSYAANVADSNRTVGILIPFSCWGHMIKRNG